MSGFGSKADTRANSAHTELPKRRVIQKPPCLIRGRIVPLGRQRSKPVGLRTFCSPIAGAMATSTHRLGLQLEALGLWDFEPPTALLAMEKVRVGDTLSAYAKRHYDDAQQWPKIYEANLDVIDDSDEIFPGQEIRIPELPLPAAPKDRTPKPKLKPPKSVH